MRYCAIKWLSNEVNCTLPVNAQFRQSSAEICSGFRQSSAEIGLRESSNLSVTNFGTLLPKFAADFGTLLPKSVSESQRVQPSFHAQFRHSPAEILHAQTRFLHLNSNDDKSETVSQFSTNFGHDVHWQVNYQQTKFHDKRRSGRPLF